MSSVWVPAKTTREVAQDRPVDGGRPTRSGDGRVRLTRTESPACRPQVGAESPQQYNKRPGPSRHPKLHRRVWPNGPHRVAGSKLRV